MMIRDQFLTVCHEDLAMFLRERLPELDSIERMAHVAEQYMDAHCCTITGKSRRRDGQSYQKSSGFKPKNQNSSAQNFKDSREGGATSFKKPVVCFFVSENWSHG